ncbi:hypothetical protein KJS94_09160 [Flavihumibacter rivuli]|uniref:hypothetical protein n=1 Tax=Flavihumibacter rivuli TaxID=2838156 RepID=UPI001BDE4059|nr:hypothetical protein [Flavihumibacter rivuli]ULQ58363.1 hypothetical protein KJS94_09160 [Flavihumibacter rivuli]
MKRLLLSCLMALGTVLVARAQTDTAYGDYLGKYKFPDGSVVPEVEVLLETGTLMMNSPAGNSQLTRESGDRFTIVNFNGTADFKRSDSTKKVFAVHIEAMGYILDGTKDTSTNTWSWSLVITDEKLWADKRK